MMKGWDTLERIFFSDSTWVTWQWTMHKWPENCIKMSRTRVREPVCIWWCPRGPWVLKRGSGRHSRVYTTEPEKICLKFNLMNVFSVHHRGFREHEIGRLNRNLGANNHLIISLQYFADNWHQDDEFKKIKDRLFWVIDNLNFWMWSNLFEWWIRVDGKMIGQSRHWALSWYLWL